MLVTLLGHIISSEGVEVDLSKMEAVKNCPRPLTPTYIKSFLGLADYYRRFVEGFASIKSPFPTLTESDKKCEKFSNVEK